MNIFDSPEWKMVENHFPLRNDEVAVLRASITHAIKPAMKPFDEIISNTNDVESQYVDERVY